MILHRRKKNHNNKDEEDLTKNHKDEDENITIKKKSEEDNTKKGSHEFVNIRLNNVQSSNNSPRLRKRFSRTMTDQRERRPARRFARKNTSSKERSNSPPVSNESPNSSNNIEIKFNNSTEGTEKKPRRQLTKRARSAKTPTRDAVARQ